MPSVMIACGEPSGDLYAGALARELRQLQPGHADRRPRGRAPAERRRRTGGRLSRLERDRPCRGRPGAAAGLGHAPGPGGAGQARSAGRAGGHRFPRFQPQARRLAASPRHPRRVLRVPAGLGLAFGAAAGAQAAGRPRAGHLSVRGGDLPRCGHPGRVRRPPAAGPHAGLRGTRRVRGRVGPRRRRRRLSRCCPAAGRTNCAPPLPTLAAAVPRIAARVPGVQFVVARAPNLPDGLFDPLRAVRGSRVVGGRRARPTMS